jgi:hypothetical protein
VTPTDGAGAVPAGGGSSLPLPGGPGIDPAGITTGARGASLERDAKGAGNAGALYRVKRGLDRASANGRSKRRGGAPKGERVPLDARPRPKRVWVATSDAWRGPTGQLRLFGAPPPFIFLEAKDLWLWSAKLGRGCVAGTQLLSAPAIAGEGDHWSERSERTVVEGAPDVELRFLCKRFSLQEEASGHVWRSRRLLRRVESCAPSTALRAVPLPRYRGGG